MKKIIIKLTTVFTLLFVSIFMISFTKADAATSKYSIATQFTFSDDMDIDEGFNLIKPYILYQDGTPCFSDYQFNANPEGNNVYHFTGFYPDGSRFSITSTIRILSNASGTYVEAEKIDPYRQTIYIKSLDEGKTSNDCLMECWKNRWVNIVYPTYNLQDTPSQNIYPRTTSFSNAAGTHHLIYYAVIENVNVTPPSSDDNTGTNNNDNNKLPEINLPTGSDEPTVDNGNTNNNNNTPGSSNNNNNNNQSNDKNTSDKDPVLITLYCIGAVLGIVLIFILYKVIRMIIKWLKR